MNAQTRILTCSMCGHQFDPVGQAACQSCPLQPGCMLVRCPACGFETVDPAQSNLAKFFSKIFPGKSRTQPVSGDSSL